MADCETDRPQFSDVVAVIVPLPAQGHLNQLLHLARRLSAHGILVHYLATATHVRQTTLRADGCGNNPATAADVHFHELPAVPYENPQPNPSGPNKFPSQLVPSLLSSKHLRRPVFEFVDSLSRNFRKVVVIYDVLMAYVVQDMGSLRNIEPYSFCSHSAFTLCAWEILGTLKLPVEVAEVLKQVPSMDGYYSPGFGEFLELQKSAKKISRGVIYNSNKVIEGLYLDILTKRNIEETIWGLGPFHPLPLPGQIQRGTGIRDSENPVRASCLAWLDKQGEPNSVVYISFGTTCSFTDEQIKEIAIGLERSGHKFLWVIRDADKGNIFTGVVRRVTLPDGFEARVQDRALIVRDWAPQVDILSHRSTGGFVTHCGWNSCLEGISAGVAMGTWPMHSDQPGNAVLITEVLGIGVEVSRWTWEDELVAWGTVERGVRKLMGREGEQVRIRAEKLGKAVREAVKEGGEMGLFLNLVTR